MNNHTKLIDTFHQTLFERGVVRAQYELTFEEMSLAFLASMVFALLYFGLQVRREVWQ